MPGNRTITHTYRDDSTDQNGQPFGAVRVIGVSVLNEDGFFQDVGKDVHGDPLSVTVTNASPTVQQFSGPSSVGEGTSATFTFVNPNDASAADRATGYTYRLVDNATNAVLAQTTTASTASPVQPAISGTLLADGPRTLTVRGEVVDKDGGRDRVHQSAHRDQHAAGHQPHFAGHRQRRPGRRHRRHVQRPRSRCPLERHDQLG